jgi:hypothetical protein
MAKDYTIKITIEGEDKASPSFKQAEQGATGFTSSIAKSIGVFAAAQVAGNILTGVIDNLTTSFRELTSGSLQMAGKFQEMEFAALALGRAMGLTEDTIRTAITDLNEAGIRYDIAAKTTATLARNQIDLSKAFDLARIAQATGILVGEDSSATMERLTYAATTGNTIMLRRMGIFVDMNQVMEEGAALMGKSVDALTMQEKAELRVNAIIKESASIMEVYGAAMESPTKALRSLTGRVIPEMQAAIGSAFLPAWKSVIDTVTTAVKWFTAALKEGGVLYPVMIQLGGAAAYVADGFKNLVKSILPAQAVSEEISESVAGMSHNLRGVADVAASTGNTFITGLAEKLTAAASTALRGGIEISASLAEGLIKGAAAALTAAMNYIGALLSSWLSPGSPPKVAKDIAKWGAETFTEYLKGFGEADFSVLEDLQSSIKDVLSALVSAGELGAGAAGDLFKSLTYDIAEAIAAFKETGKIDPSIFDKLTKAGGKYGKELAELARRQMDFAIASEAAKEAQEALKQAMEAQETAQDVLQAAMDDYNKALAEGAAPEVLKAKKAAFLEAKKEADQAKKDVKLAEEQNKKAQERLDPLKEQASLQEKLLKQLLEFTEVQKESTRLAKAAAKKAGAGAGAGAGLAEALAGGMPTAEDFDISSPITEAIENAKEMLAERFATLFDPLREAWENVQPTLEELKIAWGDFHEVFSQVVEEKWPVIRDTITEAFEKISEIWETILKPALEGLVLFAKDNWPIIVAAIVPVIWTSVIPAFTAWAVATLAAIGPILLLGAALVGLGLLWKKYGEQIKTTVFQLWFIVMFYLNEISTFIRETFTEIYEWIKTTLEDISETWSYNWETFKEIVSTVWDNIVSGIQEKIADIKTFLLEQVAKFIEIGEKLIGGLKEGIMRKVNSIIGAIRESVKRILSEAREALGIDSPSRVFEEIGRSISEGLALGIMKSISMPIEAAGSMVGDTISNVTNNNFNMTVNTRAAASTVIEDYQTMRAMVRA